MNHPQAQTIRIIFVVATGTAALIASGLYYYFYFLKKGKTQPQLTQKTGSTEVIINKETSSPLFNKSEPVNYPPPHRGLLNDRDPVMVIERKSVGSRRKNEELFAEELYTAGRKKDSYPEGKLSPKESRDPSKRGIQLKNWGSATHRDFLANAKPQKKIYHNTLKIDELEKDASDDKIFRKTLDHIGQVLLNKSKSIRKIFRRLDYKYYGYLTVEAFRKVLDEPELGLQELTTEEKDTIVNYCNCAHGKIDYKEFFTTFFEQTIKKQLRTQGKGTLKQIFVIVRHGSRFPLHPIPLNSGWSSNEQFWKLYGGKLTPRGINQHYKLGLRLGTEYLQELRLLPDSHILPEMLHVYTSNTDRTIFSVSSLLDGMFPYVSQSFVVEDEPERQSRNYQGIRIHIATVSKKNTPVLHGYKNNPKFDHFKKKAFDNASLFKEVAKDPEYIALLDKLWQMTNHECISPEKDIVKRFSSFGTLYHQIAIERALKMQLFANIKNLYLTPRDEEMIEILARESRHVTFCGNTPAEQQELGRAGSGLLPFAIIDSFSKRINNLNTQEPPRKKIVIFSAHDFTIMALLSHFGFRNWALPNFSAYVILELHYIKGKYYVVLRYNSDPARIKKPSDLRYYIIPTNGQCINMEDSQKGLMEYEEFERILMETKKSFISEEDWYQDAHSINQN